MHVEIRRYRTAAGREPFSEWLLRLGDVKSLREGVGELRIDWGPGYRLYFGRSGCEVIILLCGGDKRTQDADIRRAMELWKDYENRQRSDPRGRS